MNQIKRKMQKYKVVALLPMKANSERVKGKNFKHLNEKPLFQWILDTLLSIPEIDLIVINTDAKDILLENGLVETNRILIRNRKPELQGDMVSMNLILQDDIDHIPADTYLMTHTTNPFLGAATIKKALTKFNKTADIDSLFSVNRIQTRFYTQNLTAVNHNPNELMRTQDLEPWFEENSCLYIFTQKCFSKTNARIGEKPTMHITPPLESIDIDEPEDWQMAEAIASLQKSNIN